MPETTTTQSAETTGKPKKRELVLYIANKDIVKEFKKRAQSIDDVIKIGTFKTLAIPTSELFENITNIMASGQAKWTIFHLPSMGNIMDNTVFVQELKNLVKNSKMPIKKSKTYVIDEESLYNGDTRTILGKFGITVINDEIEIGTPFDKILTKKELILTAAAEKSDMFNFLGEEKRLPGMRSDTPSNVDKDSLDPFSMINEAKPENDDYDPFAQLGNESNSTDDLFAGMSSSDQQKNSFLSTTGEIKTNKAVDDLFNDELFEDVSSEEQDEFEDAINEDESGMPNADKLFALNDQLDIDESQPFPKVDNAQQFEPEENSLWGAEAFDPEELASSAIDEDPFAGIDNDTLAQSDIDTDQFNDQQEYYGNGMDGFSEEDFNSDGTLKLDSLLNHYAGLLGTRDIGKLLSMREPEWDYTIENEENVGSGGFLGGIIGNRGKISQVDENTLAESKYIKQCEEINGYYSPPDNAKIIACASQKGGTGKTTISVMVATQLNWYFNRDLLQRMTASMNARVLILSINEFDDIPTHGIGYAAAVTEEEQTDGRNILELLRRIEQTNGKPSWKEIEHCFTTMPNNMIFYLPSISAREAIDDDIEITAADYQKALEVCSRFFQFIVIDCPDIFYQDRNDLMSFAFTISDVITMIIEPDARSTRNLYNLFQSFDNEDGTSAIDPSKCILAVNKYVTNDNPYMPVPKGQLSFEDITKTYHAKFAKFVAIPMGRPTVIGNVLNGSDAKVKYAAAELADDVLEIIDAKDEEARREKLRKAHRH